jgi:hypothetical protein
MMGDFMMGELSEYWILVSLPALEHVFTAAALANCDCGAQSARDTRAETLEPACALARDPQTANAANNGPQANETAPVHLRADLPSCRRLLRGEQATKSMRPPSNP